MNKKEQPNYYAIIPATVRYDTRAWIYRNCGIFRTIY